MLKKLLQHISIPSPGHEKPKLRRRIALRRYLAAMLCGCMMVPTIGSIAMATEETAYVSGPCEHHTEHDADCGYVEAVEGADCQHIHDENCGYVEAKDEVPCYCPWDEAAGMVVHAEGCGYQAPVEGQPCNHVHDADCGYVEAVEGQPCGYVCEICSGEEIGSEPTPLSDAVVLENDVESTALDEAEAETTAYAVQAEGIPEPSMIVFNKPDQDADTALTGDINLLEGVSAAYPNGESLNVRVKTVEVSDSSEPLLTDNVLTTIQGLTYRIVYEVYDANETVLGEKERTIGSIEVMPAVDGVQVSNEEELKAAIKEAEAGTTIVFSQDISVKSYVDIQRDITLNLNGKTLIGPNYNFAIVAQNANVTIQNGTVSGASNSGTQGINIKNNGNYQAYLRNINFTGYTGASCLAAYLQSSSLTVENCRFYDNTNTSNIVEFKCRIGAWGAVGTGDLQFIGCKFQDNTSKATSSKAPLYINDTAAKGTVSLTNCVFENNIGWGNAGAICNGFEKNTTSKNEPVTVILNDCQIANNVAKNAGALYINNPKHASTRPVIISNNTVIKNNKCTNSGDTAGGGVYAKRADFTMSGGALYNNTKAGAANDIRVNSGQIIKIPSASTMSDDGVNLKNYVWKNGTKEYPDGLLLSSMTEKSDWFVEEGAAVPDPVAEINGTAYMTFKEAMEAVKDNETVKLLQDVESGGMYVLSTPNSTIVKDAVKITAQNITVDMNGYTITATDTADKYGDAYGIFQVKDNDYSLTLTGNGKIEGKIITSTNATLNLNGDVAIGNVISYGNININSHVTGLSNVHLNNGAFTVHETGSLGLLSVDMNYAMPLSSAYDKTLNINGPVKDLYVKQNFPSSGTVANTNTLYVNAKIDKLDLTQTGIAQGENRYNKAYINAPVAEMKITPKDEASSIYLDSEIGKLELHREETSVIQVGSKFKVNELNFVNSFINSQNIVSYANPTTPVDDVILITGISDYQIIEDQIETSDWKVGSGAKLEYQGVDYKYLTTVKVIDGKIVLHKINLDGEIGTAIYVDGVNGNDENNGLDPAHAVKTLEGVRAKLQDGNLNTVYVVNTVTVDGTDTLDMRAGDDINGIWKRYKEFTGALIRVNGDLTLQNVIIDGGKNESIKAKAPLIIVNPGAILKINDGADLRNNKNTGSPRGGAINNQGSLVIAGGIIQQNSTIESGGGVYSTGSVTMSGGEVSHNRATAYTGAANIQSTGGGICIDETGSMNMTDGLIMDNETVGKLAFGGGIALGGIAQHKGMRLTMSGGTVQENRSTGNGGGIAVWSGSEALITGGNIIKNKCNINNAYWTDAYFGGGGIYVNKEATLTLKTVEITNNGATGGTGIAACPTSDVRIYIKNGAVIYDDSVYISTSVGQKHAVPVNIASYTLNGYKYNWKTEGRLATAEDLNRIIPAGSGMTLLSGLTTAQGQSAATSCGLHIVGNKTGDLVGGVPGGGVGCNGTLIIGEETSNFTLEKKVIGDGKQTDNDFHFTVAFKTNDGNPYTGTVKLLRDGNESSLEPNANGEVFVTLEKDEYVVFRELPVGIHYTVTEGENHANSVFSSITTAIGGDTPSADTISGSANIESEESNKAAGITNGYLSEVVFTNIYDLELSISKKVEGTVADKDKEWAFKVTLADENGFPLNITNQGSDDPMGLLEFPYTMKETKVVESEQGSGEITEQIGKGMLNFPDSTALISLKHGQTITFTGIPAGTKYTIEELDVDVTEFSTNFLINNEVKDGSTATGEVAADGKGGSVVFTNTKLFDLSINKRVQNQNGAEIAEDTTPFTFQIELKDKSEKGLEKVIYTKGDQTVELKLADGVGEIQLKHGETAVIKGLPFDTQYKVSEIATNGYQAAVTTSATVQDAEKPDENTNDNEASDKDEENSGGISSQAENAGQDTETTPVPEGAESVTLAASTNGKMNDNVEIKFVNKKDPDIGGLTISKQVTGAGDKDKPFQFKLVLLNADDTPLSTSNSDIMVTGSEGVAPLDIAQLLASGVQLKHGQSVTISNLPIGTKYKVSEEKANQDGYTTTVAGTGTIVSNEATGSIQKDVTASVTFTNHKDEQPPEPQFGALTITKTVSGNRSSTQRDFTFTVTLRDASGNLLAGTYPYTGSHEGNVENGTATFLLRHGQSITISGLPAGTTYEVTEEAGDYSPTVSGGSGTIQAGQTSTAAFDNYRSGGGGGGGGRRPTPDTEIDEPPTPQVYYPGEEPDPNEPDSPDEITIIDEDVPQTYIKTWDPENEEYVYIPEEPTPLAPITPTPTPFARLDTTPKTDDPNHPWFWFGLCFASIFGIGLLRPRKKEDDK